MFPEECLPPDQPIPVPSCIAAEKPPLIKKSINHTAMSTSAAIRFERNRSLKASCQEPVPQYVYNQPCYVAIMRHLMSSRNEQAGILFGPIDEDGLVTHFRPDTTGVSTEITFTLGHDCLNQWIDKFKQFDFEMKGIVHSHPKGFTRLSTGDLGYLETLFANPANRNLHHIFMPIVSGSRMHCYVVTRNLKVRRQPLVVF